MRREGPEDDNLLFHSSSSSTPSSVHPLHPHHPLFILFIHTILCSSSSSSIHPLFIRCSSSRHPVFLFSCCIPLFILSSTIHPLILYSCCIPPLISIHLHPTLCILHPFSVLPLFLSIHPLFILYSSSIHLYPRG